MMFCSTSSEDAENEMTKQDVEKVEALMKALQAAKDQVWIIVHVEALMKALQAAKEQVWIIVHVEALMKALQAAKEQVSELFYMYIPVK